MSDRTTYLVTGANRGIGKGFIQSFLSRPSSTVIAAIWDPAYATSKALENLLKGEGSKLVIVKLDSSIATDAADAVRILVKEHGILALDVVIANAGISQGGTTIRQTTVSNTQEHFNVNTIDPLVLFQATADLLSASKTGDPKFIAISTFVASINGFETLIGLGFPFTSSPYGGNMATSSAGSTNLDLKALGAISVEESVAGMLETIDAATRDVGGTFQNYDGNVNPW
ncbi:Norsolorinic acid ketoreductase nor1 [Paramyrothecium foliicola]|nr:Norsolorinic acid ketoreductase nor1 [Paramyrothecium foliicola]